MTIDPRKTLRRLPGVGRAVHCYSLRAAEAEGLAGISRLPASLKCLLENLLRAQARGLSDGSDAAHLVAWLQDAGATAREIRFRPDRMLVVDSSGMPLFGDLAALRDALARLGGDPGALQPRLPLDLIVDHSSNVDVHGRPDAVALNLGIEIGRNRERYGFLRWAQRAFDRVRLFPPGAGICHQINLEYLARVVACERSDGGQEVAHFDSLVGMDSHTPMVNALGVVGWGVGGLEGGAAALGEPVTTLVPPVCGVRLRGRLPAGTTAADLVLTITERLRREALQGHFIEYGGDALRTLALPDRATIANMTPECGATMGFFPIDEQTLAYLRATGRDEEHVALVRAHAIEQGVWHDPEAEPPRYSQQVEIDLASVEPCVAGPAKPQQRVPLARTREAFDASFPVQGSRGASARDGEVVIAAITSCTHTANPAEMLGAGLLARNARRLGLRPPPTVKASLAPGSLVVADYLRAAGLQDDLDALGFHQVAFGCTTCMGNSGPLHPDVTESLDREAFVAAAVLSGNRNFEGRIHTRVRANFLASPPLVVAYALAGTVRIDLTREPVGTGADGRPVHLADIWPDAAEVAMLQARLLTPQRYRDVYSRVFDGPAPWRAIEGPPGARFPWDAASTFIRRPPFLDGVERMPAAVEPVRGARILAMFGDMLTTDHISPIGVISPGTPADRYLQAAGIAREDYVNYAARRLNHDVMVRGTFANVRLRNEMTPGVEGSSTLHHPGGQRLSIHEAAERYRQEGVPLVIVAGREYGAGSSRDWAAKGTRLLGVRAVIAESFERIHRSNLVGMGVLPLEFRAGDTRRTLGLDGSEQVDIEGIDGPLEPRQWVAATIVRGDGSRDAIALRLRLDTEAELGYFRHGGLLPYILRLHLDRGTRP